MKILKKRGPDPCGNITIVTEGRVDFNPLDSAG